MSIIKAGQFEVEVRDPYPCWITISYQGNQVASFGHKELSDIEYAISKAIKEAKLKLGPNKDEV